MRVAREVPLKQHWTSWESLHSFTVVTELADPLSAGSVAMLRDWELEHAMSGHKLAPEGTAHSTSMKISFYAPFLAHYA